MKQLSLATALSLAAITACSGDDDVVEPSDCADEPRADTFAAGMSKTGEAGIEFVLAAAAPTPPAKNDNTWTLRVLDSGAGMNDLVLDVVPFMPDHGHGTPIVAETVSEEAGGIYVVEPVNLWMPGLWETTVSAFDDAGLVDNVVFSFCIDG
jgi:hypothetical protein